MLANFSLNLYKSFRKIIITLFDRRGSEKLCDLPKLTYLVNGQAGTEIYSLKPTPVFPPLLHADIPNVMYNFVS